jgi:hypothetical protein
LSELEVREGGRREVRWEWEVVVVIKGGKVKRAEVENFTLW